VREIIERYCTARQLPIGTANSDEVLEALRTYIDTRTEPELLYPGAECRWHRQQLALPACRGRPISEIYGAEMLLRCIVRLPVLAASVRVCEDAVPVIATRLIDLLDFLQSNATALFK